MHLCESFDQQRVRFPIEVHHWATILKFFTTILFLQFPHKNYISYQNIAVYTFCLLIIIDDGQIDNDNVVFDDNGGDEKNLMIYDDFEPLKVTYKLSQTCMKGNPKQKGRPNMLRWLLSEQLATF